MTIGETNELAYLRYVGKELSDVGENGGRDGRVQECDKCGRAGATKGARDCGTWEKGRDMRAVGIEASGR